MRADVQMRALHSQPGPLAALLADMPWLQHSVQTFIRMCAQASSCAFLFFQRGLLAALLADVAAHPAEARRLPLIMAAYGDAHGLLERATGDATALKKVTRCSHALLPKPC